MPGAFGGGKGCVGREPTIESADTAPGARLVEDGDGGGGFRKLHGGRAARALRKIQSERDFALPRGVVTLGGDGAFQLEVVLSGAQNVAGSEPDGDGHPAVECSQVAGAEVQMDRAVWVAPEADGVAEGVGLGEGGAFNVGSGV